ncbi:MULTISPECIES: FTR1 family iron permease [Bifidobacterium]|jgi:high-affinity iron transporter|nr:FTR1 family protein [Bifidobacterium tibiigranuli]MCH3973546.1 FTR1 family iron permease [Bifidobacterium tibiigranuli]MCI1254840.1 FTR1 family iron permease [Bifidobacterium tibiigranuli]
MPQSRRRRLRASFAALAFALMLVCSSMLVAGLSTDRAYAQDVAQNTVATSVAGKDDASAAAEVSMTTAANETAAVRPIADKTAPASAASAPADPTDYASWNAVATQINAQLDATLKSYVSGDASTANSDVSTAYNVGYVASNFVMVARDTLGADRQQTQAAQFQSIQQLTYAPGHEADLQTQIAQLQGELAGSAKTLDATANLANPRDYAAARTKVTQQQRKKLQSEKKGVFNGKGNRSWAQVAKEMSTVLDSAVQQARSGDKRAGINKVNEAYYQYYEKLGFEKNVMNAISGSRVSLIENQFAEIRKSILDGDPISHTTGLVNQLKSMLAEDAAKLDGGSANQGNGFTRFVTSAFGQAFVILIREGLEALLVVTAIIAYLVKSGNRRLVVWIYVGVVAGLIGSGIVALLFGLLFSGSGPQQEIMEGVVALIAMVMLLYTSNWMLSKSSVEAWNSYITAKAHAAVDSVTSQQRMTFGGVISLAMLSFLAVFREGAETVMFYQSIYSMSRDSAGMWAGGLSAAVVLVVIFLLLRFTSVKIPLRPFFMVTSILMALLVITFAGGGVHSLIESTLISGRYIPGVPTNDWIGLYPYWETIIAQILATIAVVASFATYALKERRKRAVTSNELQKQASQPEQSSQSEQPEQSLPQ